MQLCFQFGCRESALHANDESLVLDLPNAVLAGSGTESWRLPADEYVPETTADFAIRRSGGITVGVGCADLGARSVRDASNDLYRQLLQASGGLTLHRIWNFVPQINKSHGAIDQYMEFCIGRAEALDEAGVTSMPAASAVGTAGDKLSIAFIAGDTPVRLLENPRQIPAYRYPPQYGPKSPSFSRGALLEGDTAKLYISGTASIRASESLHAGEPRTQAQLALENLGCVAAEAGLEGHLTGEAEAWRTLRVYVRDAEHWAEIEAVLDGTLRRADQVNAIQAELCRDELLVEIEAFVEPARGSG